MDANGNKSSSSHEVETEQNELEEDEDAGKELKDSSSIHKEYSGILIGSVYSLLSRFMIGEVRVGVRGSEERWVGLGSGFWNLVLQLGNLLAH